MRSRVSIQSLQMIRVQLKRFHVCLLMRIGSRWEWGTVGFPLHAWPWHRILGPLSPGGFPLSSCEGADRLGFVPSKKLVCRFGFTPSFPEPRKTMARTKAGRCHWGRGRPRDFCLKAVHPAAPRESSQAGWCGDGGMPGRGKGIGQWSEVGSAPCLSSLCLPLWALKGLGHRRADLWPQIQCRGQGRRDVLCEVSAWIRGNCRSAHLRNRRLETRQDPAVRPTWIPSLWLWAYH